jgi:uncharacterized membrane protein YhaH (DUF805 family)
MSTTIETKLSTASQTRTKSAFRLRLTPTRLVAYLILIVFTLVYLGPLLMLLDRRLLRFAPFALPGVWAFLALVPAAHDERYSLVVLPFYVALAGASLSVGAGDAEAQEVYCALVFLDCRAGAISRCRSDHTVARRQQSVAHARMATARGGGR